MERPLETATRNVDISSTNAAATKARVLAFTAEPRMVPRGKTIRLIWETENARKVNISGLGNVSPSGEYSVAPLESTIYVLTASDGRGNEEMSQVAVNVGDSPRIARFSVTPDFVAPGESTSLAWQVDNADEVTISGIGDVQPIGNRRIQVDRETQYTLSAHNRFGPVEGTLSVYLAPGRPILSSCMADPEHSPKPGAPVTLTFRTENVGSVILDGYGAVRSPIKVAPTKDVVYKFLATGRGGEATCEVKVAIAPPQPAPKTSSPGKIWRNERDGLDYARIPSGSFLMGCSPTTSRALPGFVRLAACENNEKPIHRVSLSRGFWMAQSEVTVGAYKRFVESGLGKMPLTTMLNANWHNEDMPVVNVSWDDAKNFCEWAGGRLPTEAEWEYAARAESTGARYGELGQIAWFVDNSGDSPLEGSTLWNADKTKDKGSYHGEVKANKNGFHAVKGKAPNSWNLYDMLGNVWEWTADWSYEYKSAAATDPTGLSDGEKRSVRGGSFEEPDKFLRASFRRALPPDGRWTNVGFRCIVH